MSEDPCQQYGCEDQPDAEEVTEGESWTCPKCGWYYVVQATHYWVLADQDDEWRPSGLEPEPSALQTGALPTEL